MTITRNFKLCLNAGTQNAPYINVNQYDEGEEWVFDLYTEGGQKFTPSTGAIIGIKSDGNAILNSGTVNSDGQVVITETQQMTAASGLAVFELLIEGETHGTANFIVNVERRPSDDAEFSDSDLSMLQEAIDAAEVINEVLDEGGDPSEIIAENVNNWLDNHPEATTTVEDGAITAPKINNSLWDKILVNEEASGNPASFEDGADDVPVSSLKVALEPIQTGSGDPSPTNIRPIYPANGKNLCNMENVDTRYAAYGLTVTKNVIDGTITLSGTPTWDLGTRSWRLFKYSGAYSAGYKPKAFDVSITGTAAKDVSLLRIGTDDTVIIQCTAVDTTPVTITLKPMLYVGDEPTSYQPYQDIVVERTGKNLIYPKYAGRALNGITYTINADGTITTNGTATGSSYAASNLANKPELMQIVPAGTYTLTGGISANEVVCLGGKYTDGSSLPPTYDRGSGATFTLTKPAYLYPQIQITNGTSSNRTFYIQLERGSEATEFEPYTFTSYPISLGREVYGGTVDLATGVLTLTKGFKNITASDNIQSIGSSGNGWQVLRSSFDNPPLNTGANYSDGIICDRLKSEVGASSVADDICFVNTSGVVRFNLATVYADKTELFAALGEINVAYPIEPQTINLTPTQVKTLLGYNNISSTGTVDVIYHADTKLYIDKKIGELS